MKPKTPFIQPFSKLPQQLPLYKVENALLPGGQLPLELSEPKDLALFFRSLKTDQLIGMIQPRADGPDGDVYTTGCAGRIRQYRERKDGRLNVMLVGVCRYRVTGISLEEEGYSLATVDWTGFENDYEDEQIEQQEVDAFKSKLRLYFDTHRMQVDWKVLDEQPTEDLVNNLILVLNFNLESKQKLLESLTVTQRMQLFSTLLENKEPIRPATPDSTAVN